VGFVARVWIILTRTSPHPTTHLEHEGGVKQVLVRGVVGALVRGQLGLNDDCRGYKRGGVLVQFFVHLVVCAHAYLCVPT